jgi:predicted MFS family arabinose efflux permease
MRKQLTIILLGRTVVNVPSRVVYPFLPAIARGLGVSLTLATRLTSLRVVAGLTAPLLGPLSDRFGRRRLMELGLVLFTLAGIVLAGQGFWRLTGSGMVTAVAVAFVLYGLAKAIYDPAVLAYLGDSVPYARRARAVGVSELSWSAAWLLGVPATGFLMERFGWRAPWTALVFLGILGAGITRLGLPNTRSAMQIAQGGQLMSSMLKTWVVLLRRRKAALVLTTTLLLMAAVELPLIVYGVWLETTFGLSLGALGLASTVIGLAEAAGEVGTVVFTDRLGERRSVLAGMIGLTISLLLLPWIARFGLAPALAGVVLVMLSFEFAYVSLLPLVSEVAPDARAALLSFNVTAASVGRLGAALVSSWLWRWQSIALQAWLGGALAMIAAVALALGMRGESPHEATTRVAGTFGED